MPVSSVVKDHIGPYRLLRLIRVGKTAQVWEAINATEDERFALKVLLNDYCKDKAEIAALKHEYTVGRQLEDETVNRIHEFDISRGTPYIVMDLFDGPNIKQAQRQTPELIQRHMEAIILQGARGLGHMHSRGWAHRDVKPDNFLINDTGQVKLIDFSIAQRIKKGFGKLLAGKPKMVQGTRSYMAPEQIRGQSVDERADIYSFGCMIFELLAGRLPYTGTSSNDLLTKHLKAVVPSVVAFNDNITADFGKLIGRMMAKEADQRPQSMDEVLEVCQNTQLYLVRPRFDSAPPSS
ncbi:MAG: serine/threonine protein kinase [Planctomycetales bacterium]|nr:serine/threonine protein kinase [Planctomycetales bacterium]